MKDKIKKILKEILGTWLVAYGAYVLMYTGPLTGLGPWSTAGTEIILMLIIPIGLLFILAAAIATFFKSLSEEAGIYFLRGLTLLVLLVPTAIGADRMRILGFQLTAHRAQPVITAIQAYRNEKGTVPTSIQELTPEYLPRIPYGLPKFNELHQDKDGTWTLGATVSVGVINWDSFYYRSDQNYPQDSANERIGDWIYYHE